MNEEQPKNALGRILRIIAVCVILIVVAWWIADEPNILVEFINWLNG